MRTDDLAGKQINETYDYRYCRKFPCGPAYIHIEHVKIIEAADSGHTPLLGKSERSRSCHSIGIADNKILNYARDICLHHHERVDGKGYPEGLRNGEISVWSKVVGIADAYDALTQDRCYKQAFSKEKALAMILNGECGAFEPILLDAFLDVVSKFELQPQSCSALSAACRA